MRDFLQRNTAAVVGLAIASLIIAVILGILLIGARDLQEQTLSRIDKPPLESELPGRKDQISARSRRQIDTLLAETPHILGGWVVKLKYDKTEYPVIHLYSGNPIVLETMRKYKIIRDSGGLPSDMTPKAKSIKNSEEARAGLIKCGPISGTNLTAINIDVIGKIKGVCRASIPPFTDDINLAIIVAIDVDGDGNGPEIQAIRRMLLQLQIDVFNRDYQGRETWARSVAN